MRKRYTCMYVCRLSARFAALSRLETYYKAEVLWHHHADAHGCTCSCEYMLMAMQPAGTQVGPSMHPWLRPPACMPSVRARHQWCRMQEHIGVMRACRSITPALVVWQTCNCPASTCTSAHGCAVLLTADPTSGPSATKHRTCWSRNSRPSDESSLACAQAHLYH